LANIDIKRLVLTASLPAVVSVIIFYPVTRVLYPPPVYTLLVTLSASVIRPLLLFTLAVGVFHFIVFTILNSYLLSGSVERRPRLAWLPSVVASMSLLIVFLVSLKETLAGARNYPFGLTAIVVNMTILLACVAYAVFQATRRVRSNGPTTILRFNCFVYCALVAVLLPYTGELP
jgi:hypothetical protein